MLHSDRRTDAVVLDALIAMQPDSDLIVKVVRGLMAARENGRWGNTQENVWVILAMDRYFNTFENVEPDFIARVWLGDTYVAESEFRGYTTDTYETTVPMRYLTEQEGTQDVVIAKEGDGRLYYRLGLTYAPTDLTLDPLDMGFVVQRTYEAVDDPADVVRGDDGVWRIKEGARVRIKLTLVAVNRRYHVALVDRLPAGWRSSTPTWQCRRACPARCRTQPPTKVGGGAPGTTIKTCAMPGPRRSPPICGTVSTPIAMWRVPRRRERTSYLRRMPRRCTRPKSLGAPAARR
jgi:hypothetical protein